MTGARQGSESDGSGERQHGGCQQPEPSSGQRSGRNAVEGGRRRLLYRAQVVLGLILGIAALVLVARAIDFEALKEALRGVRPLFVLLTLLASLLTPVLKAIRWRWLFHPLDPGLSTLALAGHVVIGQATNFLIPGRWGELVRTFLAGEDTGISKWTVLGTLAAEKLIDLVVLAVLVLILLPAVTLPEALAGRAQLIVGGALAVTVVAVALLGGRSVWMGLVDRVLVRAPAAAAARWRARIDALLEGLAALGRGRAAGPIWRWTLLFWATAALTNLLLLLAFGQPPSIVAALLVLAALQGGIAVPSTPGKIGVFQLLSMAALAVAGVPQATGLAFGIVQHVLVVGSITAWAALTLWRRSLSLSGLVRASASWQNGPAGEV